MYNISVQIQQHLTTALAVVSLSETDEQGRTTPLATAVTTSKKNHAEQEDSLHTFCEQAVECVVKALSTSGGRVWAEHQKHGRVDGGWGGAGESGQPERSEDE